MDLSKYLNGHAALGYMDGSVIWSYTDETGRPTSDVLPLSVARELVAIQGQIRNANALVHAGV